MKLDEPIERSCNIRMEAARDREHQRIDREKS